MLYCLKIRKFVSWEVGELSRGQRGIEEELNRVEKLFGTKKFFRKKSATESNLKTSSRRDEISNYKYLLFATHGIFIPYALIIAGNKNTAMSLWKVYDAATAEFVSTFFIKILRYGRRFCCMAFKKNFLSNFSTRFNHFKNKKYLL